ncbi:MAG: hypothetical protein ACJAVZ_000940 [Afipia broomeae]|jgi:hypothetical protein
MPRETNSSQSFDDVSCLELPRDADGQTLAAELVDDAQHPERFAVMGAVGYES